MSEQATRFASRPTAGWWEDCVRAELGYLIQIIHTGNDDALQRQQKRLESLCRLRELKEQQ